MKLNSTCTFYFLGQPCLHKCECYLNLNNQHTSKDNNFSVAILPLWTNPCNKKHLHQEFYSYHCFGVINRLQMYGDGHASTKHKKSEHCPVKAFWQAVCGKWKANLTCASRHRSTAWFLCVRVWEKMCVRDNNRRFVCGLIMAEDNISWQVCMDQTLHRQSPARALSSVSLCCLSTSNPPTLPLPPPLCWEITAVSIASIVSVFFCEVRMGFGALCLFLHAPCSAIYQMTLQARYRWSKDQPWIVSAQKQAWM